MEKVDLTGQRFGHLIVLKKADKRLPRGARTTLAWECRCDCGAITYKATDTLRNRNLHMCARCKELYAAEKARENAGFSGGTQISKLKKMNTTAANTSGVRGVEWDRHANKWRARLRFQGKLMSFGCYDVFEEAVAARKAAEELYFGKALEEYENAKASDA